MDDRLPPELQLLADLVDAQPEHIQVIFRYCLAMLLVEGGRAELLRTEPSDSGALCTFQTVAGDIFTLPRPVLDEETERMMIEKLCQILEEEGGL